MSEDNGADQVEADEPQSWLDAVKKPPTQNPKPDRPKPQPTVDKTPQYSALLKQKDELWRFCVKQIQASEVGTYAVTFHWLKNNETSTLIEAFYSINGKLQALQKEERKGNGQTIASMTNQILNRMQAIRDLFNSESDDDSRASTHDNTPEVVLTAPEKPKWSEVVQRPWPEAPVVTVDTVSPDGQPSAEPQPDPDAPAANPPDENPSAKPKPGIKIKKKKKKLKVSVQQALENEVKFTDDVKKTCKKYIDDFTRQIKELQDQVDKLQKQMDTNSLNLVQVNSHVNHQEYHSGDILDDTPANRSWILKYEKTNSLRGSALQQLNHEAFVQLVQSLFPLTLTPEVWATYPNEHTGLIFNLYKQWTSAKIYYGKEKELNRYGQVPFDLIDKHVDAYEETTVWPDIPNEIIYWGESENPDWQCASAFSRACIVENQRRNLYRKLQNENVEDDVYEQVQRELYGTKPDNWDATKKGAYSSSTKTKRARVKVFEGTHTEKDRGPNDEEGETVTLIGLQCSRWLV